MKGPQEKSAGLCMLCRSLAQNVQKRKGTAKVLQYGGYGERRQK